MTTGALITVSWSNAQDDDKVNEYVRAFLSKLDAATKEKDLYIPFTFLNDAQSGQEIYQYYGDGESLPELQQIAQKYDPQEVFQKLETGGFKLVPGGGR